MSQDNTPKLSIKDPLSADVLKRLSQLQNSRQQVANNLMDLELSKVQLLVAAQQIDDEKGKVFQRELVARGLAGDTPVEIDGTTGAISLVIPDKQG